MTENARRWGRIYRFHEPQGRPEHPEPDGLDESEWAVFLEVALKDQGGFHGAEEDMSYFVVECFARTREQAIARAMALAHGSFRSDVCICAEGEAPRVYWLRWREDDVVGVYPPSFRLEGSTFQPAPDPVPTD